MADHLPRLHSYYEGLLLAYIVRFTIMQVNMTAILGYFSILQQRLSLPTVSELLLTHHDAKKCAGWEYQL